ncbi:MAG: hypothetical protein A2X82_15465 [Geobacteraceae bacterium GWC2_55_20]|nr:MAG: hypothetical protein A2X82_15465 [Geobacteraceae bacterium GWC2_55_20]OGU22336.1 MAG: hypothetical protein A2X85_13525 [Geobacteraceae bacterium GWF2_54_21]HCE68177.1 hypothetical protein [Geobacter sp.]
MTTKNQILTLAAAVLLAVPASSFAGKCNNTIFNPVTDVAWNGLFPIRVGGVKVTPAGVLPDAGAGSETTSPVCACSSDEGQWVGLKTSFWDIANLIEVVETPGCSTTFGKQLYMGQEGFHGGGVRGGTTAPALFKQTHWVSFPVMSILNLMTDMKCASKGNINFLYPTEFDPSHNNDLIAVFRRPDNFLFANPAFDLLQPANALQANTTASVLPAAYDALFWLYWDTIYPLSGSKSTPHDLEGSAQIAAKQIYSFYGTGMLQDQVKNVCQSEITFTPKKSHWRFQLAKPVKTPKPFIPGQSEFVWGMGGKNPPFKEGNFLFVLFQKRNCCERLY